MRKTIRRLLCPLLAFLMVCSLLPPPPAEAVDKETKLIAFTFDDGPSDHTPDLLDGLEKRGAVATFFMCGANGSHGTVKHKNLLPRMYALGCELANHSYSHSNFFKLNAHQMNGELNGVEEYLYAAVGGTYLDVVRIPGGRDSEAIRDNVAHPIVRWSVDPFDWRDRDADTVYERIMEQAFDGAVVLLHDLYPTSIEGGLRAIDALQKQGYTTVTVSELFRRRGIYMENGVVYNSAPNKGVTKPAYTAPVIETAVNALTGIVTVTMWSAEQGVDSVHYTTDGTIPTLASPKYSGPITVSGDAVFQAAGFDRFATRTPVTQLKVGVTVAQPRISSYTSGLVALTTPAQGAEILFTTDGSDPRVSGKPYSAPFTPGAVTKAVARNGKLYSGTTVITKTADGSLFYDVPAQAWYYSAVSDVVKRQLMNGTSQYRFSPEGTLSRGALVSILYRLEGSPSVKGSPPFTDVPAGYWCADAVTWAASYGIITGTSPTTFDPSAIVTRQQAATILYRYAQKSGRKGKSGGSLSAYRDGNKAAEYAVEALQWCEANGLIRAVGNAALAPEDAALRGQCAYMFSGLCAMKKK